MTQDKTSTVFNFNAGPAVLPVPVMDQIAEELKSYQGSGISILEMGHRSKEFDAILNSAKERIIKMLGISDNYDVFFMPGGARLQFSMIPMNLCKEGDSVDMIHSGAWTKQAMSELKKVAKCNVVATSEDSNFSQLPDLTNVSFDPNAAYVHLCSNNTIAGTQWKSYPDTGDVPLVVDMTSDILSRRFDPNKLGIFFASAQKNLGIAGVTIVGVRKDLIERGDKNLPIMMQYRDYAKANSLINTVPVFPIYVTDLILQWIEREGGLDQMEKRNNEKAALLYSFIDSTDFYQSCAKKEDRSLMNATFRVKGGDEDLEAKFVSEAKAAGLVGLKGHRSVGGLRASIYNAQPREGVEALISFMKDFESRNG